MEARSSMQAIGNWLFKGSFVYLLAEPEIPLRVKRINWGRQTSDLQDGQGRIYPDISWDDMEFWNPEDYHLAGE